MQLVGPACESVCGAQSHTPPAGQSDSVGTAGPACSTAALWNLLSDSSGELWQSLQPALPTNSRAPFLASSEIAVESASLPALRSAIQRSNGELVLTSVNS